MQQLPIAASLILLAGAACAEDFASWKPLTNPFPSTGGGGVMIHDYKPVVSGATCKTDFGVQLPEGQRMLAEVEFDAKQVAGGVLCDNGRYRMKDGSGSGTTPFRVFIKDGVARGHPLD